MTHSPTSLAMTPATAIRIPNWALAVAVLALISVYLLLQENGTVLSAGAATWLHEMTHDARHALGVPCH